MRLTVMRTANVLKRETDKELLNFENDDNISISNIHIIGFITFNHNKGKDVYQKDIEKFLRLKPSTVSANLKLLEKKGYVHREYSKKDTRLKRVLPTEKSFAMQKKMCTKIETLDDKIGSILDKEEQEIVLKLLTKFYRGIDEKLSN